jgi:two-component system, NtrC family, sensor kinase
MSLKTWASGALYLFRCSGTANPSEPSPSVANSQDHSRKKHVELLRTFADQAVIAIENTRLLKELRESLQQQTATADVLKVISRSALDVQRVLDALVESAARLCDAYDAAIYHVFGDGLRLVAHHGPIPFAGPVGQHTIPLVRERIPGRAVIDRRTLHIADVLAEAQYPESRSRALQQGWRTALGVPLVRAGEAIGVIFIRRTQVRPFTERQIELVDTFADQAVIAIENTRLFEEAQERTRELTEPLEYQTAILLNVISPSPNRLQPVFDVIALSASRLCGSEYAIVARYDGELHHLVAQHNPRPGSADETARWFPHRAMPPSVLARAVTNNAVVHISDIEDEELPSSALKAFRRIALRDDPRGSGDRRHRCLARNTRCIPSAPDRLLSTFANQAVIAIENTRLFEEVEARTRELSEALEQQTATGEVLNVISRSPSQLQPVLDAPGNRSEVV